MRLYNSLYETSLKQELPKTVIGDLVRVFANDVDFQRPVAAGNSFEAFYEDNDESDARNELLYASITTRGETLPLLSFPRARRRLARLLRRERPLDAQIPDPQTHHGRRAALDLRHAPPSDPALYAHAYGRRLGGADRHADLRGRQRHGHQGGA